MNRISRNIFVIMRAERAIARRRMAVLRNQTTLMVFACLVAAIALVMLNVAAFLAISTRTTPQMAALIVSLTNTVLAIALVMLAARHNADTELEPVTELRNLAIEELEAELEDAVSEARTVADNVAKIARDPMGSLLPSLVGPLLALLARTAKDKK